MTLGPLERGAPTSHRPDLETRRTPEPVPYSGPSHRHPFRSVVGRPGQRRTFRPRSWWALGRSRRLECLCPLEGSGTRDVSWGSPLRKVLPTCTGRKSRETTETPDTSPPSPRRSRSGPLPALSPPVRTSFRRGSSHDYGPKSGGR